MLDNLRGYTLNPMKITHYFDIAASHPFLSPRVQKKIEECLSMRLGNASSVHLEGRQSRKILRQSRECVAQVLDAQPEEVIFTSGSTEALNLALHTAIHTHTSKTDLVSTAFEHAALREPLQYAAQQGHSLSYLSYASLYAQDAAHELNLEKTHPLTPTRPVILATHYAHHHTGYLMPMSALHTLCRKYQATFILDATQAGVDLPRLWSKHSYVRYLALSGHKIGAPTGVGVLLARHYAPLIPMLQGGPQENNRRAGTESILLIAALAEALSELQDNQAQQRIHLNALVDCLETALADIAGIRFYTTTARVAGISAFGVIGIRAITLVDALSQLGYSIASSAACESTEETAPLGLLALGMTRDRASEVVRVSCACTHTQAEVLNLATAIKQVVAQVRP